jgi:hypothetical protein
MPTMALGLDASRDHNDQANRDYGDKRHDSASNLDDKLQQLTLNYGGRPDSGVSDRRKLQPKLRKRNDILPCLI